MSAKLVLESGYGRMLPPGHYDGMVTECSTDGKRTVITFELVNPIPLYDRKTTDWIKNLQPERDYGNCIRH